MLVICYAKAEARFFFFSRSLSGAFIVKLLFVGGIAVNNFCVGSCTLTLYELTDEVSCRELEVFKTINKNWMRLMIPHVMETREKETI